MIDFQRQNFIGENKTLFKFCKANIQNFFSDCNIIFE